MMQKDDYVALSLIIKCNPGSSLSYEEKLGFVISGKAGVTFAVPDDLKVVGGGNKFHLVSNGNTICWVTLK